MVHSTVGFSPAATPVMKTSLGAEIGAELLLGEVRGAGDEIARGEPQEDGGEREDQREACDDVVAVLGEEAPEAIPRGARRGDGGAVPLRLARRCLRRGLVEAGLEGRRRGDEKRADQEQEQKKDPGAQSEHPRRSALSGGA